MSQELLLHEDHGAVRLLTINRPDAANALNIALIDQLHEAMRVADQATDIRVVVLTGAGDRAFVAGADITELKAMKAFDAVQFSRRGQELMLFMDKMSIPVIAAVNGFALGGGLELALGCDFMYAAQSASFGLVEANLGLIPGYGGVTRLSRRIGEAAAREALFTARRFSADEAFRLRLVNRVVSDEDLLPETLQVAQDIAQKSPGSLQLLRYLFASTRELDTHTSIALEQQAFGLIFTDDDGQEGIQAFMEKRKPKFSHLA